MTNDLPVSPGKSPDYPSLRASSDHRFIVGALRALKDGLVVPPFFPRPRVAREQEINGHPPHPFQARLPTSWGTAWSIL